MAILRHSLAILLLPVMVVVVVPGWLITANSPNVGWSLPMPLKVAPLIGGPSLAAIGLVLIIKTVRLFATIGQGTLAPWSPPQTLVIHGVYRHVRNPMISGVLAVLLGEAVLFGSWPLLVWFLVFLLANGLYMPLLEEPGLEQRFGVPYRLYKKNVPRWIPRLIPWTAPDEESLKR